MIVIVANEQSYTEHVLAMQPSISKMIDKVLVDTGHKMTPEEVWSYLAYTANTFLGRLKYALSEEHREVYDALLVETSVSCMARLKATYGKPFPAPDEGTGFESPEELDKYLGRQRGVSPVTMPKAPPAMNRAPSTPEYVPGGYL